MWIKHPTLEQFLGALCENMIICEIVEHPSGSGTTDILAVYQRHNQLGYFYTNWCLCKNCIHPVEGWSNADQLQSEANRYARFIRWCNSFAELRDNVLRNSDNRHFLSVIDEYIIKHRQPEVHI